MTDAHATGDAAVGADGGLTGDATADRRVTAHTSAPGRTVLTERGNTDGWLASDLVVDAWR